MGKPRVTMSVYGTGSESRFFIWRQYYRSRREGSRYQYLNKDDNLYLADYIDCLAGSLPTEYHVQDSLENYKKLEPMINQRYSKFKNFNI